MGTLYYGAMFDAISMPDVVLAHLKAVVTSKLRRGECFPLSWQHAEDGSAGQTTIWLHPSISLKFVLESPEPVTLDVERLHRFVDAANSNSGLVIDVSDSQSADRATSPEFSLQKS